MSKSIVEKRFKTFKMTTAKWTSIGERIRIYAIVLQDLMKRECLQVWGGDALMLYLFILELNECPQLQQVLMSCSAKHIERELCTHHIGGMLKL